MNNKNKTKWLVTLTFGVLMAVPTMISYAGVTGKKAVAFGAMNATGPGVKSGDGVEQKQQNHVLQGIAVDVSYDVTRFSLPTGARNLIVVEGFARNSKTAQSGAKPENLHNKVRVIAYHRDNDNAPWVARVKSLGVMGWGGMSNHRFEGSGITPIGLFKMGTAFGRKEAMEGFSKNYVKIDPQAKSQYWSKRTNRLESNANTLLQDGEKLWASGFAGIYDYVIDSGFNVNNANGDGSALFLHCTYPGKATTGGCVAIDPQAMIAIEKMYATGDSYIAQAPFGQFEGIYSAYNETGKMPQGTFSETSQQLDDVQTEIQW